MKKLFNSFRAAFAMYSRIPMPLTDWSQENLKYMFVFFPFVGAVIGLLSCLAAFGGRRLGLLPSFGCAVLTVLPILVTGGIHVDGLLDTADALSSWRERERRLEILKDPHMGAFGVITAGVYFLLTYGAFRQIWDRQDLLTVMGVGYVLSRCLSGISVMSFPKAKKEGTVAEFSLKAEEVLVRRILAAFAFLCGAGMVAVHPAAGGGAFVFALLVFAYYGRMSKKYFGGITGDLAGFFLCICETGMTVVLGVLSAFV
ncbi:MAG: adenosylcobinamide-GDP ribazoletransferase [Eubacteriales bacterium]|nr:adenosylcobinamide-GDP ribazoletransferase [Eubacteriales bacterium]